MNSNVSLKFENTNGVCPIGETTGKRMIENRQIPVISCEGACIRGEIARIAANMMAKKEGYGRGCHGEMLTVPQSEMAKWGQQAEKIVIIDGCFLHCHGRAMKGVYGNDQLLIFDALSYYKKYTEIMDIDDVPEKERKETAIFVLDCVLKDIESGLASSCDSINTENSCCSIPRESTAGCCG